jgi:hypothetical protein
MCNDVEMCKEMQKKKTMNVIGGAFIKKWREEEKMTVETKVRVNERNVKPRQR